MLPDLETVRLGDATIAFRRWGDDASPAIVFWHAIGTVVSGAYAGEIAPVLVEHGFRVIALDGPGHGGSPTLPPEEYALPDITDLAASFVYELGLDRFVWMGHSWGAMVGAHFAARFPTLLRALVLLDAGHSDPQDQPGYVPALGLEDFVERATAQLAVRWPDWDAFVADARDGAPRWTPALEEALRGSLRRENGELRPNVDPHGRARALNGLYSASITETWPALAAAQLPILLLVATEPPEQEDFRTRSVEEFRAALPDAEVHRIAGARHDLLFDAGPDVARRVGEWLARSLV